MAQEARQTAFRKTYHIRRQTCRRECMMAVVLANLFSFFPPAGPAPEAAKAGFRLGDKGTHSSRTLMLAELEAALGAAPAFAKRAEYAAAIIEGNCLGKATASTRRISNQRLGELFALDPYCAVFRVLRKLWDTDAGMRPLLAMLGALARDPLFRASAEPVLSLAPGGELQRAPLRDALRMVAGERMNADTLDKVMRNVSSSWTQAGHLQGRTFKFRQRVEAQPAALAFALWLGHAAGFRGEELLNNGWIAALDCTASSARGLALDAKRVGLIELRSAGDVLELGLDGLDPGRGRR
jgi:hypothetical protein